MSSHVASPGGVAARRSILASPNSQVVFDICWGCGVLALPVYGLRHGIPPLQIIVTSGGSLVVGLLVRIVLRHTRRVCYREPDAVLEYWTTFSLSAWALIFAFGNIAFGFSAASAGSLLDAGLWLIGLVVFCCFASAYLIRQKRVVKVDKLRQARFVDFQIMPIPVKLTQAFFAAGTVDESDSIVIVRGDEAQLRYWISL